MKYETLHISAVKNVAWKPEPEIIDIRQLRNRFVIAFGSEIAKNKLKTKSQVNYD